MRAAGPTGRPTVLFLNHSAALSGAELFLLRVLGASSTVAPAVVLGEDGPLRGRLEALGVPVTVLPLPRELEEVSASGTTTPRRRPWRRVGLGVAYLRALRREIRRVAPALVYTNSAKTHVLGQPAARLAGVPGVLHAHDQFTRASFSVPHLLLLQVVALLLPRRVVANSASTRATLWAPTRRRAVAVPCPTEVPATRPGPGPSADGDDLVVGLFGRLSAWKGQHVALEALALLEDPRVRLHLFGAALFGDDEAYEVGLRERVRTGGLDDRVVFHGHVHDVAAAMADCDVVVHTSVRPEPFGQVVVEAMAAGRAVVAADAGGPREVLEDGVTGLLHPPGDAAALADRLRLLRDDPALRAALGRSAHRAAGAYSLAVVVPRWERLLTDLAAGSGRRLDR